MLKYIVTGLVLNDDDPNTANFCVPLIVNVVQTVVDNVNAKNFDAIRAVGRFEFELAFPGANLTEVARLLARSLER